MFKSIIAISAVVASAFAAIDWTGDAALACSKENWATIKATGDPLIPMAGALLSDEQKATLDSLLGGASTLPAEPSNEFLRALPTAIPPNILDASFGPLIQECVDNFGSGGEPTDEEPTDEEPTVEEPTDEEPTDEEPTDEEPTDEEPTGEEPTGEEPTGEEPTGEQPEEPSYSAEEPPKCIPRPN